MIKEKAIALSNNRLTSFNKKWEQYTAIYDFRGPGIQIYSLPCIVYCKMQNVLLITTTGCSCPRIAVKSCYSQNSILSLLKDFNGNNRVDVFSNRPHSAIPCFTEKRGPPYRIFLKPVNGLIWHVTPNLWQ